MAESSVVTALDSFMNASSALRTELNRKTRSPEGGQPYSEFCPPGAARNIFDLQNPNVLALYIYAEAERKDSSEAHDNARRFLDAVLGQNNEDSRSNILAILLSRRICEPGAAWRNFEQLCLMNGNLYDHHLPIDKQRIVDTFGGAVANDFNEEQFRYCPIVFSSKELVSYLGHKASCRVPFIEKKKIGSGAHSKVYAVRIAAGHFKGLDSSKDADYVQKHFKVDDSGGSQHEEWALAKWLIEATFGTGHRTINFVLAALVHGPSFSLLYERADCDLWAYMHGAGKHPKTFSDSFTEMKRILRQVIGIADGLRFLHNDLRHYEKGRMTCFHLDLKPQNILVYNLLSDAESREPHEVFKITDFSISGILWKDSVGQSTKEEPEKERSASLNKLFSSKSPAPETPNSTPIQQRSIPNLLGHNCDCIAPEAMTERQSVSSAADVWAFGCVLTMVLAWLLGESDEVLRLQEERGKVGNRSWFFEKDSETQANAAHKFDLHEETTGAAGVEHNVFMLNRGVETWYTEACDQEHDKRLAELCKSIWQLLRPEDRGHSSKGILIANPKYRLAMDEASEKLERIHEKWLQEPGAHVPNAGLDQSGSEGSMVPSPTVVSARRSKTDWVRGKMQSIKGSSTRRMMTKSSSFNLMLEVSKGARACSVKEHVDGSIHLAYRFDKQIQTFYLPPDSETAESSKLEERKLPCPNGYSWSNLAIGEAVLCATSHQNHERSCIYVQHLSGRQRQDTAVKIYEVADAYVSKLTISETGSVLAFSVSTFSSTVSRSTIHWAELPGTGEDKLPNGSEESAPTTLLSTKSRIFNEDILDLRFSSDGKFLYAIANDESTRANVYLTTIETGSRKLIQRRCINGKNTNDWNHPLFTALAPFGQGTKCLMLLSRCRIIICDNHTMDEISGYTRDKDTTNNLVAILPLEGTRFLAVQDAGNCLKVFEADSSQKPAIELKTKKDRKTKVISNFAIGKDCASIVSRTATYSKLMIARSTGTVEVLVLPVNVEDGG